MNTLVVSTGVSLQAKLSALRNPALYPDPTTQVESMETHCAWVFLTDHYVYKLKKPMRLGQMDNLLLSARHRNCREEIRLNRRLAPDVYLDVVPLIEHAGQLSLDGAGTPVDWLVKMRRLPSDLSLDRKIASGQVSCLAISRVSDVLTAFYRRQPPARLSAEDHLQRMQRQVAMNGLALLDHDLGLPRDLVASAVDQQEKFLRSAPQLLAARAQQGRIIEAHGDLKPEHVFLAEPPCIIDCLEFDRELRLLDPFEELAYLALECERMGAGWIGQQMIDEYAARSGERVEAALLEFYVRRRASERALSAAWHLRDPAVRERKDWRARAIGYLGQSQRLATRT